MFRFISKVIKKLFPAIDSEFEKELSKEILRSERTRIKLLIYTMIGVILLLVSLQLFFPHLLRQYIGLEDGLDYIMMIMVAGIIYEYTVSYLFGRFIALERQPPIIARYANALVETSVPSVAIYIFAITRDPIDALLSPPSHAYFFFILLSALRLDMKLCIFTGFVASFEFWGMILYFYSAGDLKSMGLMSADLPAFIIRGAFLLAAGILAGIMSNLTKNSFVKSIGNMEKKNQLINLFGQHVSKAVVDRLLDQKIDIESEIHYVCVMFLDIRKFTHFAEKKSPVEVLNYLNSLFSFMIDIVNANNGIINKFLGDGFMAVFGAPISDSKDVSNAMKASLEILKKVDELNRKGEIYPTKLGIGLHCGEAFTGNIGSIIRKEYTVIGDVVNLASRIEQFNKIYHTQILFSEEVKNKVNDLSIHISEIGTVKVKGRDKKTKIYTIKDKL